MDRGRVQELIKKYGRRLQTALGMDLKYIVKGIFWLSSGNTASALIAFGMSIAFANLLSKETFGEYRYVLSMAAIFSAFSLTGTNTAVTQAVARGFEGTYRRSIWFQLKWSLPYVLGCLGVSVYYAIHAQWALSIAFFFVGFLNPITFSFNTFLAFLNGRKDFRAIGLCTVASGAFVASSSLAVICISPSAPLLIIVSAISNAIANVLIHIWILRRYSPNNSFDAEAFSHAKRLSLLNIFGMLSAQLDSVLIFHFLGPAQLAIYAFSTNLPDRLRGFSKNLQSLAIPKYANRPLAEIRVGFVGKFWKYVALLTGVSVAYAVIVPFVFPVLFPKYIASIPFTQVYALSFVTSASAVPVATILAKRHQKQLAVYSISTSIVQVICTGILIPYYGLWGAVIAKLLSMAYNFMVAYVLVLGKRSIA